MRESFRNTALEVPICSLVGYHGGRILLRDWREQPRSFHHYSLVHEELAPSGTIGSRRRIFANYVVQAKS